MLKIKIGRWWSKRHIDSTKMADVCQLATVLRGRRAASYWPVMYSKPFLDPKAAVAKSVSLAQASTLLTQHRSLWPIIDHFPPHIGHFGPILAALYLCRYSLESHNLCTVHLLYVHDVKFNLMSDRQISKSHFSICQFKN